MNLVLTEDQELLAKTAADFAEGRSPVSRLRALRDEGTPPGFSRELWREMGELGWLGIPFPEELGGAELGVAEMAVVLEALGRNLAPEPLVESVLFAGHALLAGGSEAQRQAWIPGLCAGERVLAVAWQEAGSRFDLCRVGVRAEQRGDTTRLVGEKLHVEAAPGADAFLVSARHDGGPAEREGWSVFLVPAEAPGLEIVRQVRVDSRPSGMVRLDGVEVGADALLGEEGRGAALLGPAFDRAAAGQCAEMLGGMSRAFDMTLEHLKQREQFGVPIGSFQALKHRAARCFIDIELARSAAMAAARALDADAPDAARLVSLAKARCSDAYVHVANEAVQMFGGVGMTDEYDVGFYLKRARAAELSFGDAAWHRDRWARLGGY